MKRSYARDLGVLALFLTVLGGGIQKASAEIQYDTYLHCGEYLGADPDVNLVRYSPDENFRLPMWAFSYATKTAGKVRTEVSCIATSVAEGSNGSAVFSGSDCSVALNAEADGTFSITYEDKAKVTGCVFDLPREQAASDLQKDIAGSGVAQGGPNL